MAWIDDNKENVFDARFIGRNLINYFKAHQADALAWAMEDSGETVKPIDNKQFFLSKRIFTVFPVCFIDGMSTFTEPGSDTDQTTIEVSFEVAIKDGDTERMARQIPIYEMAFTKMFKNIEKTSLENGSKIEFDGGSSAGYATTFEVWDGGGGVFINSFRTTFSLTIDFQNRS